MKQTWDDYRNYVLHPRFGRRPRLTAINPTDRVPHDAIPNTAVVADVSRQKPSSYPPEFYFDQKHICVDCRRPFIFFADEQKYWYEELGFSLHSACVRCVECRKEIQTVLGSQARLKMRYDELIVVENRSPQQDLEVADLCLSLIEEGTFSESQLCTVRRLIKSGKDDPTLDQQRASLRERIPPIEARAMEKGTIPRFLIDRFPASEDALFDLCSSMVTNEMVKEISEADYGHGAGDHLRAIEELRSRGFVHGPMRWEPREVLELMRWSEPEQPEWKPGQSGRRGHQMRAFCCAALLTASIKPSYSDRLDFESATLIQLIDSALELQEGIPQAAIQFILAATPRAKDRERVCLAVGLLILVLQPTVGRYTQLQVTQLCEYVTAQLDIVDNSSRQPLCESLNDLRARRWMKRLTQISHSHRYSNVKLYQVDGRFEPLRRTLAEQG